MCRGVPVACSDRSSLPEVAGDAALLFDPAAPEQVTACVRRLLTDALQPIHALDSRAVRTLEPAVTFDAERGRDDHGR